jgi:exodeoxyribonuclease X
LLIRVIDIETTGLAPPAEIIEIGRVDVVIEGDDIRIERPKARLYRPLNGIPPETMAVHHLTEADFDTDMPVCTEERLQMAIWNGDRPDVLVAHNCEFEQSFIPVSVTKELPWVCTHKVALRVWPDAPKHSNQVLRYWRGLALDAALAMPPHRAGPDAWVTAHLLADLARTATIAQMIDWSARPKQLPTIPFGKHRGAKWAEAPLDYLQWMVRQKDMDGDAIACANEELARRTPDRQVVRAAARA